MGAWQGLEGLPPASAVPKRPPGLPGGFPDLKGGNGRSKDHPTGRHEAPKKLGFRSPVQDGVSVISGEKTFPKERIQ